MRTLTGVADLFSASDEDDAAPGVSARAPLAVRMRPRTLDDVVGQSHLLGPGSPLRRLVDGGELSVPHEGSYESGDAWAVEGHGVEPDIVVRETPTELAEGRDPQLEAAVQHLLTELEGRQRPARPRPPGQ